MFQCTACGLLSVRDTSCPGCGGTSFLDLEAEDTTSLEGFGEVPGLDEAATALHEIAPPPEPEPVEEEEPEGDLPFGFGGMARAHAPSLPFGFGASSLGLAALQADRPEAESPSEPPASEEGLTDEDSVSVVSTAPDVQPAELQAETSDSELALPPVPLEAPVVVAESAPSGQDDTPSSAQLPVNTSASMAPPAVSVDAMEPSAPGSFALVVPDLWSRTVADVREAYGLEQNPPISTSAEPALTSQRPAWPPFAVVAPEAALLDGLLREPTVEAFRALANEDWSLAKERFELVLATGVDGISLRTGAGIACMELGDESAAGLQHLKQAAKLSGGNVRALHNLALGMAMDGRVEGVERLLATVANLPDEGGLVSRMHDARRLMNSSSA
jgi:hypothetical protein